MNETVQANLQRLNYIISVWTQDAAKNTRQELWLVGMNGVRASEKSVLLVWHDDVDIYIYIYI